MAGPCIIQNATQEARDPQPADCDTTSRKKVLAWGDCDATSYPCGFKLKRTYDQWYTAFPPYHNCHEGIGPPITLVRHFWIPSEMTSQSVCSLCPFWPENEVFMKGMNAPIDNHTQPHNGTTSISVVV
jgi:hypothetical protein